MKDKDQPWVDNYPPLKSWLDKHSAMCQWQIANGTSYIEGWIINGHIIVIEIYANKHGWNIYTAGESVKIDETFKDAEKRVGL